MICLKLPFSPSVNTYYRKFNNRMVMSPKGREFKKTVKQIIDDQELSGSFGPDDRLKVEIDLSAPTRRKYDIDNRIKAVLDSLQDSGVFEDDEQIDCLVVNRKPITQREGYAIVKIEVIKQ